MEQLHHFCKSVRDWVQTVLSKPNRRRRRKAKHGSVRLVGSACHIDTDTYLKLLIFICVVTKSECI